MRNPVSNLLLNKPIPVILCFSDLLAPTVCVVSGQNETFIIPVKNGAKYSDAVDDLLRDLIMYVNKMNNAINYS